MDGQLLERAGAIADGLLWPNAAATDAAEAVPAGHLDALADAGLYGLGTPAALGGLEADLGTVCAAIELLAAADLTTTFVWAQHLGAIQALARSPDDQLRRSWLPRLCGGQLRAGLILAGALPGPPRLQARQTGRGQDWIWSGVAPWLSGWTRIDVIAAAARDSHGNAVWALIDAAESPTLAVEPVRLFAVNASRTVRVRFDDHRVPAERIAALVPEQVWSQPNPAGQRVHAALNLGVARRAQQLLGPSPLDAELAACRAAADEATQAPDTMPAARAAACELALRATAANFVAAGANATAAASHASRLVREAAFLLVTGSRPAIKTALLERLAATNR